METDAKKKLEEMGVCNAASHRNEWMCFTRQVANENKFPVALAKPYKENKVGLFNMWLQNRRSLDACELVYKKRLLSKDTKEKTFCYKKLRDMNYPEAKKKGAQGTT